MFSKTKSATKKVAAPVKRSATKKVARKPAVPRPVKKAFTKTVAKVAPAAASVRRSSSSVKTAGWFGGEGGPQDLDKWYGPSRALFLPSGLLDRNDVPDYLNGGLAGDYGFDPLGLGKGGNVDNYRKAELIHSRWAMLGCAGIIFPEGLQANGANIKGGTWFETGAAMLDGGTLDYFAVPWVVVDNPLPLFAVVAAEVALVGAAENYRRTGTGPPGFAPGIGKFESSVFNGADSLYPGGPLDPFNFAQDPEVFQELKVKEIKNGRLAMMSILAYAFQGYVTGEGPYANWAKHVSDPFGYNIFTVLVSEDRIPTL